MHDVQADTSMIVLRRKKHQVHSTKYFIEGPLKILFEKYFGNVLIRTFKKST